MRGKHEEGVRLRQATKLAPHPYRAMRRSQGQRNAKGIKRKKAVNNMGKEVTMKNQQTIMCDVCACKHHNKSNGCCKLAQITVTPTDDCATAHYCKDYEKK